MREASKAMNRRNEEASFFCSRYGSIEWMEIFKGSALDVGCGDDIINKDLWPHLKTVNGFDTEDGDANSIDAYFEPNTFDVIHGSQVIEHLHDPKDFLHRCLKILKKKGHIVMTMPDLVLYESMSWPSNFNADHKTTWSMLYPRSPAPNHIYLPDFLNSFNDVAETLLCRLVDTNYCYKTWTRRDQTFNFEDGVECWNEFVIRKK